jgi:hypothetical protein
LDKEFESLSFAQVELLDFFKKRLSLAKLELLVIDPFRNRFQITFQ